MRKYKNKFNMGWEGDKYPLFLDIVRIGKEIKKQLKLEFPNAKFSVRTKDESATPHIYINLLSWNSEVFSEKYKCSKDFNNKKNIKTKGPHINKIYCSKYLSGEGIYLMSRTIEIANEYNAYNKDTLNNIIDYKFHLEVEIGKYDKPFKVG